MLTLDPTVKEFREKIDKEQRRESIKLNKSQKTIADDLRRLNKKDLPGKEYLDLITSAIGRFSYQNDLSANIVLGLSGNDNDACDLSTYDFMKSGNLALFSDSGYGNDSTLYSIIASVATDPKNWECVICDESHEGVVARCLDHVHDRSGMTIDDIAKNISEDDGGKYSWASTARPVNVTLSDNNEYDLMKVFAEIQCRKSALDDWNENHAETKDIRGVHGLETIKNIILIVDVSSGYSIENNNSC
jgi:hypothetical protein